MYRFPCLFSAVSVVRQGPHRESKNAAHIKTRFGAWCFALSWVGCGLLLRARGVVFSSNTDLLHRHSCFPCAKRYKAGGQGWRSGGCARAVPVAIALSFLLVIFKLHPPTPRQDDNDPSLGSYFVRGRASSASRCGSPSGAAAHAGPRRVHSLISGGVYN